MREAVGTALPLPARAQGISHLGVTETKRTAETLSKNSASVVLFSSLIGNAERLSEI